MVLLNKHIFPRIFKKKFIYPFLLSLILIELVKNQKKIKSVENIVYNKKMEQRIFINYINIAINIDTKYIYPCITLLTSLLDNKAKTTFYIIHILSSGNLGNETYNKINSILQKNGNYSANVSYYHMGNAFDSATHGQYISIAAYYRISLPSLLPNLDKIIYTDTDTINFKDLTEMYNIKLKDDIYYCGPLDHRYHCGELNKLGVYPDKYINSGIMLINLEAIRNNTIEEKIKDFVNSNFLNHHEQTAINAVCYKNFQILPIKYARFAFKSYNEIIEFNNEQNIIYKYNETELKEAYYNPTFIHYAGWVKPWHKEYNSYNSAYWWYYAKKSGFYKEILVHYQFEQDYIDDLLSKIPEDDVLLKRKIK